MQYYCDPSCAAHKKRKRRLTPGKIPGDQPAIGRGHLIFFLRRLCQVSCPYAHKYSNIRAKKSASGPVFCATDPATALIKTFNGFNHCFDSLR